MSGGIFKTKIKIPEAAGGTVTDVITAIVQHRILLVGFGPEWEGYDALATADRSEFIRVAKLADTPALAGFDKSLEEVKAAQHVSMAALKVAFADPSYFSTMFTVILRGLWKARAID
jgi:AraC-like DNA-binding protein